MNTRLYLLLSAALLASSSLNAVDFSHDPTPPTEKKELEYDKAYDLMKDFLDLEIKSDKSMNYWAKQLMLLIRTKDTEKIKKLTPFLKDFHMARKMRNAFALGMAFKSHKDKFNEPELAKYLTDKINKEGLDNLLKIMKYRMKK